jgi:uncharacterized membrane protein YGL010W
MDERFQKFYISYGRYHHDPTNQWIHIVFIPTIIATLFFMTHGAVLSTIELGGVLVNVDFGLALLAVCVPMYLMVDIFTGVLAVLVYGSSYVYSLSLYQEVDHSKEVLFGLTTYQCAVALHITAWVSQFIGHGVFEGRKPALMDNIFLTLVAPAFAIIEVLAKFGHRKSDIEAADKLIVEDIKQYRASKKSQ